MPILPTLLRTAPLFLLASCGSAWTPLDLDGDGYTAAEGDCIDDPAQAQSADVHPFAQEIWYDGTDQDCDGGSDFDQDGDGADLPADCDDAAPDVHPSAPEIWYDGTDQDCDGNDGDRDGDGAASPDDCDDLDPDVHPAAQEIWYDDTDDDCDGNRDDQDGDGYGLSEDCDDLDADIHPAAQEIWYDGADDDCDGNDGDQDGDGAWKAGYPYPLPAGALPGDCADDPAAPPSGISLDGAPASLPASAVFPAAADAPYDGIDADCAGDDDLDADRDGVRALPAGPDCIDSDPAAYPGAMERCNAADDDCSGLPDDGDACPCAALWRGATPYLSCPDGSGSSLAGACAALGYRPLILDDAAEQADLLLAGFGGWIGLGDQAIEGDYRWYGDAPVTWDGWAPGQPDDPGTEDCARLSPEGWQDAPCSLLLPLLCEG